MIEKREICFFPDEAVATTDEAIEDFEEACEVLIEEQFDEDANAVKIDFDQMLDLLDPADIDDLPQEVWIKPLLLMGQQVERYDFAFVELPLGEVFTKLFPAKGVIDSNGVYDHEQDS